MSLSTAVRDVKKKIEKKRFCKCHILNSTSTLTTCISLYSFFKWKWITLKLQVIGLRIS